MKIAKLRTLVSIWNRKQVDSGKRVLQLQFAHSYQPDGVNTLVRAVWPNEVDAEKEKIAQQLAAGDHDTDIQRAWEALESWQKRSYWQEHFLAEIKPQLFAALDRLDDDPAKFLLSYMVSRYIEDGDDWQEYDCDQLAEAELIESLDEWIKIID